MASGERRAKAQPTQPKAGGVCVVKPDGLAWLDRSAGPAVALVPSEQVAVLAADLPLPSRRKRAEAAPFAVEGRIAEPLADVEVALGPEIAPAVISWPSCVEARWRAG